MHSWTPDAITHCQHGDWLVSTNVRGTWVGQCETSRKDMALCYSATDCFKYQPCLCGHVSVASAHLFPHPPSSSKWPPTTTRPPTARTQRAASLPTPSTRSEGPRSQRSTMQNSRECSRRSRFLFVSHVPILSWFHFKVCLVAGAGFFTDA